jgi:hypothetical protein
VTKPYFVDELTIPAEFEAVIDETLAKIKKIGAKISSSDYQDLTVFVDPIDGTREFATGQGDKVCRAAPRRASAYIHVDRPSRAPLFPLPTYR